MLESVHCIVFFETWALNATSCVYLYYTLLRIPVRKCDVRSRNVVVERWLISLKIQKKYKIPCLSNILTFQHELFDLIYKQNLLVIRDVSTFVAQ